MFYNTDLRLSPPWEEVGMLDTILEAGASLDWISPLASILGDIMNGPSHTFLIPYDGSPLSGREIAWMLGKRGVKTWGLMVVSGTLMVSVRLSQARWAQHFLEQSGVPMDNPLPAQTRKRQSGSRRTQGRAARHRGGASGTLVDSIQDVLNTRVF
jgi:hypothetical protein